MNELDKVKATMVEHAAGAVTPYMLGAPGLKIAKKKTRRSIAGPVKNRPKCTTFPQTLVDDGNKHRKVYYPDSGKAKYGWLVVRKEGRVALFQFTENADGTINWHPRVTRGAGGKGTIFHYDMPELPKFIAHQVARAIVEVADEEWGGEKPLDAALEVVQAVSKKDDISRRIRDLGSI